MSSVIVTVVAKSPAGIKVRRPPIRAGLRSPSRITLSTCSKCVEHAAGGALHPQPLGRGWPIEVPNLVFARAAGRQCPPPARRTGETCGLVSTQGWDRWSRCVLVDDRRRVVRPPRCGWSRPAGCGWPCGWIECEDHLARWLLSRLKRWHGQAQLGGRVVDAATPSGTVRSEASRFGSD
jgi:hypothetical protein